MGSGDTASRSASQLERRTAVPARTAEAASPREAYALRLASAQGHDEKTPPRTHTGKEAECEGGGAPSSAHGFDQAPQRQPVFTARVHADHHGRSLPVRCGTGPSGAARTGHSSRPPTRAPTMTARPRARSDNASVDQAQIPDGNRPHVLPCLSVNPQVTRAGWAVVGRPAFPTSPLRPQVHAAQQEEREVGGWDRSRAAGEGIGAHAQPVARRRGRRARAAINGGDVWWGQGRELGACASRIFETGQPHAAPGLSGSVAREPAGLEERLLAGRIVIVAVLGDQGQERVAGLPVSGGRSG